MENELNAISYNDRLRAEELKRLQILDTPQEATFDSIAKLATEIFNVSACLISLVDIDTVFFKSGIGVGEERKHPRSISLCSMAILNSEVTIFQDIQTAPCILASAETAGELGLKFYAAAPLTTLTGLRIGTIGILDKDSRSFTDKDQQLLKSLAKIVMEVMELRIA